MRGIGRGRAAGNRRGSYARVTGPSGAGMLNEPGDAPASLRSRATRDKCLEESRSTSATLRWYTKRSG